MSADDNKRMENCPACKDLKLTPFEIAICCKIFSGALRGLKHTCIIVFSLHAAIFWKKNFPKKKYKYRYLLSKGLYIQHSDTSDLVVRQNIWTHSGSGASYCTQCSYHPEIRFNIKVPLPTAADSKLCIIFLAF